MNPGDFDKPAPAEHPTVSTSLLAGAQQMDADSWSRLVSIFGPIVYRWCRSSGVAAADAPDVVQDVFASVARGICGFERAKEQGSFRSWLATVTRNRVRDHFRRHAKSQDAQGGTDAMLWLQQQADSLDSTICPDTIDSPVVRQVLQRVRAEFEDSTWQAFWMTAVEGDRAGSVAEALGISVASVYQAKSRVLRRLRTEMSQLPNT